MKKWKCTVCSYIHEGLEPPDVCPVCGAGKEAFVEVKEAYEELISHEEKKKAKPACYKFTYGLFVITSRDGEKINGQACNTAIQVTSSPIRVTVALNKDNLTCEYVKKSGVFVINTLEENEESVHLIKRFGFRTGRDVDKFEDVDCYKYETGAPIISKAIANLECRVLKGNTLDAGSHIVFLGDVVAGSVSKDAKPLTYDYYRAQK